LFQSFRPEWQDKLTQEDKRALNVLFHSHINPYGLFPLDLQIRLGIMKNNLENDRAEEDEAEQREDSEELLVTL
jgi:hypothetical protein